MEYVHGGDIYTHKGMTDFSVNLNPFGPGRAVVEAARKSIDQIGNYPDASCRKLKSALAKRLEVPAEHIICGNGAADLIFTAVLADCPRKALIPVPAFAEYEQALRATGCEICYYKKREATGFQLEEDFLDLLNEDIDMVFLCSPDNPTGKLIDRSMLWKILARCETYGIRMVLDECFIDFAENAATASILADTKRWRTLFILRSLTKMHAIPGIRIGYAVTSDMEFLEKMDELNPDLIVLAGFLVVIPPEMIAKYRNRIINIHPSLIPSFCGTGYYGLKVHEAALARGVKVVGATVHFVDEGTDTGPIILQKAVEVEEGDTPEVLQRRVMEQAEWKILPKAIDLIANGKVKVEDGRTHII